MNDRRCENCLELFTTCICTMVDKFFADAPQSEDPDADANDK